MSYDKLDSILLGQPMTKERYEEMEAEAIENERLFQERKKGKPSSGIKIGSYNSKNKNRCKTK